MQIKKEIEGVADMHIIKEVQEVMDRIEGAGHAAFAVGGSVRDALLGREPYDWDLATDASAETISALFPRTAKIGVKFGIVKVFHEGMAIDVATYRKDGPYEDCRRPCHVDFTPDIEEDLKRRDFTINAMAFSPKRGLKDPYSGQLDLEKRIIRTVGEPLERFKEDGLRMLRAVRFACQLGFDIDQPTLSAIKTKAELLSLISMERIRDEFDKILISPLPGKGLRLCLDLGLFPYILGESLRTVDGPERQGLLALIGTLDQSPVNRDIRLALLMLCFDPEKVMRAIDRLKLDNITKTKLKSIKYLVADLPSIGSKEALKKFISRQGLESYDFAEQVMRYKGTIMNYGLDSTGSEPPTAEGASTDSDRQDWLDEILTNKEPIFQADLKVNGNDLIKAGVAKGANVGKVLFFLLDHVQLQPHDNNPETLLAKASEFKQHK